MSLSRSSHVVVGGNLLFHLFLRCSTSGGGLSAPGGAILEFPVGADFLALCYELVTSVLENLSLLSPVFDVYSTFPVRV